MILLAGSLTRLSRPLATRSLSSEVLEEEHDKLDIKKAKSGFVRSQDNWKEFYFHRELLYRIGILRYTHGEIICIMPKNLKFFFSIFGDGKLTKLGYCNLVIKLLISCCKCVTYIDYRMNFIPVVAICRWIPRCRVETLSYTVSVEPVIPMSGLLIKVFLCQLCV